MKNRTAFGLLLVLWLALPFQAGAQSNTVRLQVSDQSSRSNNGKLQISLNDEISKQGGRENGTVIKAIRLEVKARQGGGQLVLRLQTSTGSRFVDTVGFETDPDRFDGPDGFQSVELQNPFPTAGDLQLIGQGDLKIRNLVATIGAPAGMTVRETSPVDPTRLPGPPPAAAPSAAVTPPRETETTRPVVAATPAPPVPAPVAEKPRCIGKICVSSRVYHRPTSWEGIVIFVDPGARTAMVRFGDQIESFDAPVAVQDLALP